MWGVAYWPASYWASTYWGRGGSGPAPEPTPPAQPTGGWRHFPPAWGRRETAEDRRRERERLGIEPKQQRAIDRAAAKIVQTYPRAGLLAAPEVAAVPQFDRLLGIIQPTEGQILALAQAIVDRIAWIVAQRQADEDEEEMLLRLMMEM